MLIFFLKTQGLNDCFKKVAALYCVSESFLRKWKKKFKTEGIISLYTKWGHNSKYLTIFDYEDKVLKAKKWIRENTNKKGEKAMTVEMFAHYCTELMSDIMPNSKKQALSLETSRRWLHQLGFQYYSTKTGYNDGHERLEVKAYRENYLNLLLEYQIRSYIFDDKGESLDMYQDISFRRSFLHGGNLKQSVDHPVIIVYHDETIYNVNDDQKSFWQDGETPAMKAKGKGLGIMISDFITEEGFLDESGDLGLRVSLEFNSEGHWTNEGMKNQVDKAIKAFESSEAVFIFDNALTHVAYEADALIAKNLNVKDGGKQSILRDTIWNGQVQKLTHEDGKPKGLRTILQERGLFKNTMDKEQMIETLSNCEDFLAEKPCLQKLIEQRSHKFLL